MSWEDVLAHVLNTVAELLVVIVIPYFAALACAKIKNSIVQSIMKDAEKTINECVMATNQTFVNALKDEGKFDEVAMKEAFDKCKEQVLLILSESSKKVIVRTVGDLSAWLETKIESSVLANKKTK